MKKKWFAALALACILLATGAFGSTALAKAENGEPVAVLNGLTVDIIWSGSGMVRIGRETPITVRVSSTGPEMSGSALVYVPSSKGNYYVLEKELSVSAGETAQAVLCVPVDYSTGEIRVEFRGENGTLYAGETLNLRPGYNSQEVYVGVLCENMNALAVFDRVVLNEYRGTATRLFDFQKDTLPVDTESLKLYDIFLWEDVDKDQVSKEQLSALESWVYDGGTLILGNTSDLCGEVSDGEIRQEKWGRGQYVYCDFSLREAEQFYPGEGGIRTFLYAAVGTERMNAIEDSIEYGYNDFWDAQSVTLNVDPDRIPSVWKYGLVLAVYLILLGPVLYTVLKKKERQSMLRVSMVGIALLFTGIIYLMGSRTRFQRPFMNYASIREIRDDMTMETVFTNVCSPFNSEYSFEVDGKFDVSPLPYYDYTNTSMNLESGNCQLRIRYGGESTTVWVNDEIPFTSETLRLTNSEENNGGQVFAGKLRLFCGELEGTLVNQSEQDFDQVCILLGGHIALIGEMTAGQEADLSQTECLSLPGYKQYDIIRRITGIDQYNAASASREAALASWRNQVLQYYLNYMTADEGEIAVVLAFPASENVEILKESEVDVRGVSLFAVFLPADYEKNGLIYVPFSLVDAEALQGSYDSGRNSVYERITVLRYDFGDIQVQRLLADWAEEQDPDEYMRPFQGTVSFYNWNTRSYDAMEQRKEYGRAELTDYLDENNCLTVRFEDSVVEDYNYEILLPCFSVVGRKEK